MSNSILEIKLLGGSQTGKTAAAFIILRALRDAGVTVTTFQNAEGSWDEGSLGEVLAGRSVCRDSQCAQRILASIEAVETSSGGTGYLMGIPYDMSKLGSGGSNAK